MLFLKLQRQKAIDALALTAVDITLLIQKHKYFSQVCNETTIKTQIFYIYQTNEGIAK